MGRDYRNVERKMWGNFNFPCLKRTSTPLGTGFHVLKIKNGPTFKQIDK